MTVTTRAAGAAGALVAFLVLAIGVRAAIQQRQTQSSGIVLLRMGGTTAERVTFSGLVLATLAAVTASVAGLAGNALGGPVVVPRVVVVLGLVVAALSIVATFWAQLAMGASWRVGLDRSERTALVTTGPYHV